MWRLISLSSVLVAVVITSGWAQADDYLVGPVPEPLRRDLKLDRFYQKQVAMAGLPVLSSTNTTDFALREAAYIVRHMLAMRPEILRVLTTNQVRIVVMGYREFTTDLPEQRDMQPRVYWDSRARGLGGRVCSCGEENLLGYPGDPYPTENLLIHEFAHVIQAVAMSAIDPGFEGRLRKAFQSAKQRGLWKNTYAGTNPEEYWAESVQDWFDNNRHDDALHNQVHTRAQLKEYDPEAAKLCAEVFGDGPWRYFKPLERSPAERAHLAGFDAAKAPRFRWREAPIPEAPRVQFDTALGTFEVELDAKAAPVTVKNFLRYANERLYNDGLFFRTVTLSNQPHDSISIQVVQAQANPAKTNEFFSPIPLERTCDTGLHHHDGTISMARRGSDTAQDHFFICIGDQPELDYGGKRNPDGQGFAAFGRVIRGMEVIRKIHGRPAEGQQLTPPVTIQRAVRLN